MILILRNLVLILCSVLFVGVACADNKESAAPVVIKPTIEVEFNDYFVTNVQADQQRKYIKLKILMTVKDQATADAIAHNQPLLRNTVLLSVSKEQYGRLKTEVGKKSFQERLQAELIETLKAEQLPNAIETLSFTEFALD